MVKRLASILIATVFAVGACASPPASQGPETIDGLVVLGVLDGELAGPATDPDVCRSMNPFLFRVRSSLFDAAGQYPPGPSEPSLEPLPGSGSSITVWIPDELAGAIGREGRYALAVDSVYDLCDSGERRWRVRYAFAPDGALLDPRPRERTRFGDDLDAMREPGESDLDVALSFLDERKALTSATANNEPLPATPRRDALRASRDDTAGRIATVVSEWAARPASERQLPIDVNGDRDLTEQLREALGLDHWARWEVLFLYDTTTAETTGWAALEIHDAGIIGPYSLDPTQTISVALSAYGPPTAKVSAIVWPPGEPQTVTGGSGTVQPIPLPESTTEISVADRATLDTGGGVVVDLRDGTVTIDVVPGDVFAQLMQDHADRTRRGSERDDAGDE